MFSTKIFTNIISPKDLLIKFDDLVIEPLGEAFGQDIETINSSKSPLDKQEHKASIDPEKKSAALLSKASTPNGMQQSSLEIELPYKSKTLSVVDRKDGKEVSDDIETIVVRDVEQGKCAPFKKSEMINEKRSANEPKYTPVSRIDQIRRLVIGEKYI